MDRQIIQHFSWTVLVLAVFTQVGQADHPAHPFFSKTQHDFGTVARGSKALYEFEFKNPYDRKLVIDHVRSSCGCTKASIAQKIIEPNATGKVLADFNTRSFLGQKSATITVVVRQPVRTEIQLRVKGNIRGDIVLSPGEIQFQNIQKGQKRSLATEIHYAGSQTWRIVDIQSSLEFLSADLSELERTNGSVKYKLTITMEGDFPQGLIRDQIMVVTNDAKQKRIPLSFSARVSSPLSVSPSSLEFAPREAGKHRLVFKADQPFQFQRAVCQDKRVEISFDQRARKTHLVTVRFTPIDGLPLPNSIPIKFVTNVGKGLAQTVTLQFD